MTQINAYIHFNGQCREAMEFYKECMGGQLQLQTVGDSPMAGQSPAAIQQQILHGSLTKGSLVLMGTDMVGPNGHIVGNNVNLSLSCSSEEEINEFFTGLSAGGKIIHPLKLAFWGALFGVFTDKYGIEWMLNYEMPGKV